MKFASFLLTALAGSATAFTTSPAFGRSTALNVATDPKKSQEPVAAGSIDRSLLGIDRDAKHEVIDPTDGDSPALQRNNNEEVWVPQVRDRVICTHETLF